VFWSNQFNFTDGLWITCKRAWVRSEWSGHWREAENQRFSQHERNGRRFVPGTDIGSLIEVKNQRYFMPLLAIGKLWIYDPFFRPATLNRNPRDSGTCSGHMPVLILRAKLHANFSIAFGDPEASRLRSQLFRPHKLRDLFISLNWVCQTSFSDCMDEYPLKCSRNQYYARCMNYRQYSIILTDLMTKSRRILCCGVSPDDFAKTQSATQTCIVRKVQSIWPSRKREIAN
jgi:hypothetical protein